MAKKFKCPYCLQVHKDSDCIYRCLSSHPCRLGVPLDDTRTIPFKYVGTCQKKCDQTMKIICPTLLSENQVKIIPPRAVDYEGISLALLGGRNSGKSNYIAVLVNEIKNKMSWAYNCSLMACDDSSDQRYKDFFWKPLYQDHRVLDSTDANRQDPLLFSLDFYGKGKNSKIESSLVLPLYDTAGENMKGSDKFGDKINYIRSAGGIILLLDPFEIKEIADQLALNGIPTPEGTSSIETILNSIKQYLQRGKGAKDLIEVPIAIVLTKLDLLLDFTDLIPPNSILRPDPDRIEQADRGSFSQEEFEKVNTAVLNILKQHAGEAGLGIGNLITSLRSFRHYGLFAVSSFGCEPTKSDLLKLRPIRVLDPLLWLLSINKYIKTTR